jgi:ABC-2 type transport system ATP-binding protein
LIQLRKLTKHFGAFAAVDGLDLEVPSGKVFGFLGPNGAGKTTTIRMLTGLLKPDSGEILIDGLDMLATPELAKARIGYVPDRPELFPYLSAHETLKLVGALHSMDSAKVEARGRELLKAFSLDAWADEAVGTYSHGMKQKLGLSAALLHEPSVLVLDEPMVGLDPKGGRQIKELLRRLAESGLTVFLSIHTLEIAEKLCDRLAILMHGKLLAQGSVTELKQRAEAGDLESVFLKLTGDSEEEDGLDALYPKERR